MKKPPVGPGGFSDRFVAGDNDREPSRSSARNQASSEQTVAELVWQCEDAVREHYFLEIYPREIRERTRRILRLAQWLDEQARTGSFAGLDTLSCLLLPPFERAAQEHAEMSRLLRGWRRGSA